MFTNRFFPPFSHILSHSLCLMHFHYFSCHFNLWLLSLLQSLVSLFTLCSATFSSPSFISPTTVSSPLFIYLLHCFYLSLLSLCTRCLFLFIFVQQPIFSSSAYLSPAQYLFLVPSLICHPLFSSTPPPPPPLFLSLLFIRQPLLSPCSIYLHVIYFAPFYLSPLLAHPLYLSFMCHFCLVQHIFSRSLALLISPTACSL